MKMPFLLISPKIVPKIQLIKKGGCFEYHAVIADKIKYRYVHRASICPALGMDRRSFFMPKPMGKYKRLEVFYLSKPVYTADKPSDCHYCYFWAGLLMLVVVLSFVLLELIGTALARRPGEQMQTRPEVRSLLTGMSLHGFADGLVLAGAFVTDSHLGWFAAFAILLHEVPQQAGAAALYRGAGYSRHKTLICLLLPTLFAAIGAATGAVTMLQPFLLPYVLIVSGTSFVYMTMRSFLPHIIAQTKTGRDVVLTLLLLIVGMAAGVALSQQEHEHAHLHATYGNRLVYNNIIISKLISFRI